MKKNVFIVVFFCASLHSMDEGMHKEVEAVFVEKNIMGKHFLPQCTLQSSVRFATTCKSLQNFLFENICFHLPHDSACLEEFKKLPLDYYKRILQHCAVSNNASSFSFIWGVRNADLESDLKKLTRFQTTSITPELAMKIYQGGFEKLERDYKKNEKKAQEKKYAAQCQGLYDQLFYGTDYSIQNFCAELGEVDVFQIVPRGSFSLEILFPDEDECNGFGLFFTGYTSAVFYLVCRYHNVDIALNLLGVYIAKKPKKAARYLLDGHYCALFAMMAKKKRIDVNLTDKKGRSALHHVAQNDAIDVATLLLQCGALVNCCDKKGRTPLHYACKHGALQVIEALLSCDSIDPHKKDQKGREPKDLLSKKNAMVKLLIEQHDSKKA